METTPAEYIANLVSVFREARRVLRDDGTLWLNLGDTYAGSRIITPDAERGVTASRRRDDAPVPRTGLAIPGLKPKDLIGIPWRVAFALQDDGWYLRADVIWHKPNPMPESVRDRPTRAHEYLFLLSKSDRYYYDADAIAEESEWYGRDARSGRGNIRYEGKRTSGDAAANGQQGFATINPTRNKRSVWSVATKPYPGAHFATYPVELITPCVLAGSPEGGTVLDPFTGSGTTGEAALRARRDFIGIELNPEYVTLARERLDPITRQPHLFPLGDTP